MHRLAHGVVPAEGEREVAHAAAHEGVGELALDRAARLDVGDRVAVVLRHAGGDGEDVRIEDDLLGREADLVDQDPVGAPAISSFRSQRVRLPSSSIAMTIAAAPWRRIARRLLPELPRRLSE